MEKFTLHSGVTVPIDLQNIDTDMIIPKQYLKTIKRTGLRKGLFAEMRRDEKGQLIKNFALNQPQYENASILIAGDNFGCGSSREHAPWALRDWGFRVIIAPGFADIFYNNCFNNSILPIVLPQGLVAELIKDANQASTLSVDLQQQSIRRADGSFISFEIEASRRTKLLEGIDFIDETLQRESLISSYEMDAALPRPWEQNIKVHEEKQPSAQE